jgi:glycosyltransferase involved in cell wall biosynthesis
MNVSSRKFRATKEQAGPLVSVIVPVYNVEQYIDDCMLSLRVQDHDDLEIIVVNDGSEDGSMKRVRAHAAIDRRIKIIEQENLGLGGARNTGVAHASGEFIVFVDSDDFVSTRCLKTLLEAQRRGGYDIVSGRHIKISDSSEFLGYESYWPLPDVTPPLTDCEKVLGLYAHSIVCARLFKRHLLLRAGIKFPEWLPHEDLFFTYKLLRQYPNHCRLPNHIYFWRQREQSLGKSITESHLCVPSRLRRDTCAFLDSVSASEREHILAARRNIVFLNILRTRVEKSKSAMFDVFVEAIRSERSEILNDFRRVDHAGKEISYDAPGLRELVYDIGTVEVSSTGAAS